VKSVLASITKNSSTMTNGMV